MELDSFWLSPLIYVWEESLLSVSLSIILSLLLNLLFKSELDSSDAFNDLDSLFSDLSPELWIWLSFIVLIISDIFLLPYKLSNFLAILSMLLNLFLGLI